MRRLPAWLAAVAVALVLLAWVSPAVAAPTNLAPTGVEPTELHPHAPADIAVGANNEISAILHDAITEIGLAGENLTFSLQTTFGWLPLKSAMTDAQGTAYLDYDPVAPGNYTIRVAFDGNAAYAPSNASVSVVAVVGPPGPAPLLPVVPTIVLIIVAVVGGAWATYAFVAIQILGIRADLPERDRKDRRARSPSEVKQSMASTEESTPKGVSGSANAGSRAVLIVAVLALVLGGAGLGLGAMSALGPKASTYTPTTVSFELAIVPDIQGAGWDAFVPNSLIVHAGDTVKITVINADTMPHGFYLPDFNVNQRIEPGTANATTGEVTPWVTPTPITFVASQTGTFLFKCNIPCGDGHDYMTGTLEILAD